jgi:pSer/pThr/pTyr-binding forkhead associated (FHA) protein
MAEQRCPSCGVLLEGEPLVCDRCGTLLCDPKSSTVHMRISPILLQLRRKQAKPSEALPPGKLVVLQIRGLSERLSFEEGTEIVLGRNDISNPDMSRLDLTPYGGHERGVSREHALIRYKEGQLSVTDLHSANGTLVNMQRLGSGQPRLIKDGDELTLGNLTIMIFFEPTASSS